MSSEFIQNTKLSDEQVHNLVWGFACGAPKTDISAQTGISEKRIVSVSLSLRERLYRPPFYLWHAPGDVFLTYDWPEARQAADGAVFGVVAMCYFDKRCRSNYVQGRRKTRLCRHCMVAALFDDQDTAKAAVAFTDHIHAFYHHLGFGGERGRDQTDILMDRWKHTMIVQRAREQSMVRENIPAFDDPGERSCRALYNKLIADLSVEPLAR
ncbi:hypothetical protein [uncultured Roseobacter sp.]|uniref:hypothetical protein n=1 Tax=uncultured Roseobacter sp. TaxID=114847 RepID=UPI002617E97C|nr:hypothetical protein [uncultured Roseobacter sp.]